MKLKTFAYISLSLIFLVFIGCSGGVGNNAPVVGNLYAEPDEVEKGQDTTLFCLATDPEGGNLTYEWNKEIIEPPSDSEEDDEEEEPPEDERIVSSICKVAGTISGSGKTVTWTAPDAPGTYEINCIVSDGSLETISSLTVTVFDPQGGTVKGEINGVSPLTNSYTLETWYTSSVTIENTSSSKRTFKIKAEESSDVKFEETEKNITLAAGETLEVSFDYQFLGSLNSKELIFNLYHDSSILLDTYTTSPIEPYQEPEEEEEPEEEPESSLSAPTVVSASDGDYNNKVSVTWNTVSGATHYRVYRATSSTGSKTSLGSWQSSATYSDYDASPATTYYYWVKAATSSNGDNTSDYSGYDTGWRALTPPQNVYATDCSYDKVKITWDAGDSAASHYQVYRATSPGGTKTVLSGWQTSTIYYDYSINPVITYYYFVKAATSSTGDNASDYSTYDTGYIAGIEYIQSCPTSTNLQVLNWFKFPSDYYIKAYWNDGFIDHFTDYTKFSFSTSDEYIAYVDSAGVYGDVMGISPGTATITITYREDTSKKAYLTVTVYE